MLKKKAKKDNEVNMENNSETTTANSSKILIDIDEEDSVLEDIGDDIENL